MARSSYIYILQAENGYGGYLIDSAYTVKRELVSHLKKIAEGDPEEIEFYRVARVRDACTDQEPAFASAREYLSG